MTGGDTEEKKEKEIRSTSAAFLRIDKHDVARSRGRRGNDRRAGGGTSQTSGDRKNRKGKDGSLPAMQGFQEPIKGKA